MNKKGETGIGTLVSIIFIAVVMFIVLSFLGVNIPALAKSALGLTEIDLINYTQENNEAKLAFNDLIEDIKKCENNEKDNCACDGSLNKFFKTHKLEFNGEEGKLVNIKESNEITMAKEDIKDVNCFFDAKFRVIDVDVLEIMFDKGAYIPRSFIGIGFLGKNPKFVYDFVLYKKDNKMCWLTDYIDEKDIEKINYC